MALVTKGTAMTSFQAAPADRSTDMPEPPRGSTSGVPENDSGGFLKEPLDAMRYDSSERDPWEVGGVLARLMPSGVKVLDIGCGTGSITLQANEGRNNDVLCVEPDRARAAVAASRGLNVVCGIADKAFLDKHGPFDVIMLSDVLEHLSAPADLLTLARAALTPGGKVLVSVPNVAHWTVRLRLLFGRFNYTNVGIMDATHLRWFTARTLTELFEGCGFKVDTMQWTAGAWMGEYERVLPVGFLPKRWRRPVIQRLSKALPLMFGCQHVLKASKAAS